MSNYLSIATVTATIGHIVGEALQAVAAPSATPQVRYGPPQSYPAFVGCGIFLYRVRMNPLGRNNDLPTRDDAGSVVKKPQALLDIDYLLAFSGDETTLEPQRLLCAVVSSFMAQPVLLRDAVRRTIEGAPYLEGSDLDTQPRSIRLAQRDVDDETMRQIWTLFSGIPTYYPSSIQRPRLCSTPISRRRPYRSWPKSP